jgi:ribosomal protein L36
MENDTTIKTKKKFVRRRGRIIVYNKIDGKMI